MTLPQKAVGAAVGALAALFALYLSATSAFVTRGEWKLELEHRRAAEERIYVELRELRHLLESRFPARAPAPPRARPET